MSDAIPPPLTVPEPPPAYDQVEPELESTVIEPEPPPLNVTGTGIAPAPRSITSAGAATESTDTLASSRSLVVPSALTTSSLPETETVTDPMSFTCHAAEARGRSPGSGG